MVVCFIRATSGSGITDLVALTCIFSSDIITVDIVTTENLTCGPLVRTCNLFKLLFLSHHNV